MDRFVKLALVIVSIYLVTIVVTFIQFLNKYPVFEGTEIVIYLIIFMIGMIMLTFTFDRNISKYIAYPLYGVIILGVKTFYDIFIDISDLPLYVPRFDYNFYIYYTHFSVESFPFKIASANAFIYIVIGICIISFIMFITHQNNKDKIV